MERQNKRQKMSQAERAKQFMPFAALKGYSLALRKKEIITVPKIELSEEMAQQLDCALRQIQKNDIVSVIYFHDSQYVKKTGMVTRIDPISKIIQIVNTKIAFDDLYRIEL